MPKCVRTGSEAVEYWDSSALIKLYAPEPDSLYYVRRAAEGTGAIITSLTAKTEVVIGLRRKEAIGDLNAGTAAILIRKFHSDCESGRIQIVPHDVAVRGKPKGWRLSYLGIDRNRCSFEVWI